MTNKYGARRVTLRTGETFDSEKERDRWVVLLRLQQSGKIKGLRRQVRYQILPTVRNQGTTPKDKKKDLVIERAKHYTADFVYLDTAADQWIVEDVKSVATHKLADYILRRHLMILKLLHHSCRRGRKIWKFKEVM